MSFIALSLLGLAIVPVLIIATLGWLALECDTEDMGFYGGIEGLYKEV